MTAKILCGIQISRFSSMMRRLISREEHPLLTISTHQNDRDYSESGNVRLIFIPASQLRRR